MTVDLLAIVAHPDDAELLCGGTLAKRYSVVTWSSEPVLETAVGSPKHQRTKSAS